MEAERDRCIANYDRLMERHHRILWQLALPEREQAVTGLPPAQLDPVTDAILAVAGTNTALRAQMSTKATSDRTAGMTEAQIVARIRAGVTDDEDLMPIDTDADDDGTD